MPDFLIDVNLPYYFSLWHNAACIHQKDINDEWNDQLIWEYAKANSLTIITKDADFSNKVLLHSPPPKVIHIRLGNLLMKDFFKRMQDCWVDVMELNKTHKLVTVFYNRIEAIN